MGATVVSAWEAGEEAHDFLAEDVAGDWQRRVHPMNGQGSGGNPQRRAERAPDGGCAERTTRLRVDLRIPAGQPLPDLSTFITRCEEAGFDGIGIHDHPASGRDANLALALAARATHRLRLFPATSSPVVRHPLLLASLAHSLDEMAPGRTYLTVAAGFLSTRSVGKPRASVTVMRQAIRAARRRLEQGARRVGRTLEGFPIVFVVTISLGSDAALGARWVRSWVAPGQPFLACPSASNLRWLGDAGIELGEPLDPAAIPDDEADRIADAFGLFGPPERCAERLLQAREEAGVEHVFLFPAHDLAGGYHMPEAKVEAFARVIRPRLGG